MSICRRSLQGNRLFRFDFIEKQVIFSRTIGSARRPIFTHATISSKVSHTVAHTATQGLAKLLSVRRPLFDNNFLTIWSLYTLSENTAALCSRNTSGRYPVLLSEPQFCYSIHNIHSPRVQALIVQHSPDMAHCANLGSNEQTNM